MNRGPEACCCELEDPEEDAPEEEETVERAPLFRCLLLLLLLLLPGGCQGSPPSPGAEAIVNKPQRVGMQKIVSEDGRVWLRKPRAGVQAAPEWTR